MPRNIRSVALALALAVLTSGAVHARPLAAHPAPASYLVAVWQWVTPYLPAWLKAGSDMDPNGYTAKAGSEMDPDGARHTLLAPPATSDAGGEMDPDG